MEKKKADQPLYKKPWFWVIIAVVLIAIASIALNSKGNQTNNDTTQTGAQQTQQQSQQSSEKTEYNLGETITVDGVDYVVSSVERNYSTGNMYAKPNTGNEYVKANIDIKNNSNSTKDYNALNWRIEDANGNITSYALMAQAEDGINSGQLSAGGIKQGSLVFEVPAGSSLKLRFRPNVFIDKDLIINI